MVSEEDNENHLMTHDLICIMFLDTTEEFMSQRYVWRFPKQGFSSASGQLELELVKCESEQLELEFVHLDNLSSRSHKIWNKWVLVQTDSWLYDAYKTEVDEEDSEEDEEQEEDEE